MTDKRVYAVGELYDIDNVNKETLRFFKSESEAELFYFEQICVGGFVACQKLAIFHIINNRIKVATGLKPFTREMDDGPVGDEERFDFLK